MAELKSPSYDVTTESLRDFAALGADWLWEQNSSLVFTQSFFTTYLTAAFSAASDYGKSWRQTDPGGVTILEWSRFEALLTNREDFKDFRFTRSIPGGGSRWYSISGHPIWTNGGEFRGYRGIGRDITDQVALELRGEAARLRSERLTLAFEASSEAIALWGRDEKLLFCNAAYRQQSGVVGDDLTSGLSFTEYLSTGLLTKELKLDGLWREAWLSERLRAFRDRRSVEALRAGRWLLIEHHRTPDGGTFISCADITELKERERELTTARQSAEAASRAKTFFLAHMSHELRTPLNAILGYSEVVRDELFGPDNPRYREYAGLIHQGGSYLMSLIGSLLDLARIEADRYELSEEAFPLSEVLDSAMAAIRPGADQRRVDLSEVREVAGLIIAERRGLIQILINLLTNAVKYSHEGGVVRMLVHLTEDGSLRIIVSDKGIGMSEENILVAFDGFRRGDATTRNQVDGAGLGLAISQRLAKLHDGGLTIASKIGEGIDVTLTLPAARCQGLSAI